MTGNDFNVSIVSPAVQSSVFHALRLSAGEDWLRRQGFTVELMPSAARDEPWPSLEDRADDLAAAMRSDARGVIAASMGGNGCSALVPLLAHRPELAGSRPLHGASDFTTIMWWAMHAFGVPCYYGPNVAMGMAEQPSVRPETARSLLDCWSGRPLAYMPSSSWTEEGVDIGVGADRPLTSQVRADTGPTRWRVLSTGEVEGTMLAGCLEVLVWWVRSLPAWDLLRSGPIVLALDIAMPGSRWGRDVLGGPDAVDALLDGFGISGGWSQVVGVVFGRPRGYTPGERARLDDVLRRRAPPGVPVLADVDIGHTEPFLTLPMGESVRLRTAPPRLEFGERTTSLPSLPFAPGGTIAYSRGADRT